MGLQVYFEQNAFAWSESLKHVRVIFQILSELFDAPEVIPRIFFIAND